MHVCLGSHALVYMCMWKPKVNLISGSGATSIFKYCLSLAWNPLTRLGPLASVSISISSTVGGRACTTVLAFQRGCCRYNWVLMLARQALSQLSGFFSLTLGLLLKSKKQSLTNAKALGSSGGWGEQGVVLRTVVWWAGAVVAASWTGVLRSRVKGGAVPSSGFGSVPPVGEGEGRTVSTVSFPGLLAPGS